MIQPVEIGSVADIDALLDQGGFNLPEYSDDEDAGAGFAPQPGDERLTVMFRENGRSFGARGKKKDVEKYIECCVHWTNNVGKPVMGAYRVEETNWWKARFPEQWAAFESGSKNPQKDFPLDKLSLTPFEMEMLKAQGVRSVKELASLKATHLKTISLPNIEKIHKRAKSYLASFLDDEVK